MGYARKSVPKTAGRISMGRVALWGGRGTELFRAGDFALFARPGEAMDTNPFTQSY